MENPELQTQSSNFEEAAGDTEFNGQIFLSLPVQYAFAGHVVQDAPSTNVPCEHTHKLPTICIPD